MLDFTFKFLSSNIKTYNAYNAYLRSKHYG